MIGDEGDVQRSCHKWNKSLGDVSEFLGDADTTLCDANEITGDVFQMHIRSIVMLSDSWRCW